MSPEGSTKAERPEDDWRLLVGQSVVLDMSSPFVYVGRLAGKTDGYIILDEADSHDLRDTSTTREKYVVACRQHGVHSNRRRVWINLREVVAISRLEDVIAE